MYSNHVHGNDKAKQSLSTLGWKAAKGKRERKNLLKLFSKIWSIVESIHDSSVRIEIKLKHQQSQPILLGKYTRSESRISARVSIPRETHDAVQCVRNFSLSNSDPVPSPPPPLPSPSLPLLLAPLNSFYRSRISPWIVGHCIKGFTSVPPRYPFEPRRGSSDGFMIENTRDKTPVRTQSRKYERSEIMRKQATGRRLN